MRALIRTHEDGTTEVMTEPFSPWVQNNLAFMTGTETDQDGNTLPGDGWTLVEDYEPPQETEPEEIPETEITRSGSTGL